jgi:hypothetical protein
MSCDSSSTRPFILVEEEGGYCARNCSEVTGNLNYWVDVAGDNTCVLCTQAECATCDNSTECTTCVVGYHLEIDPMYGTTGECVPDCGDYQWESFPNGETEGGECENCMTDCI